MGQRFIISESERNRIKKLYENTSSSVNEQDNKPMFKRGDILTVINKGDKSPKPKEILAGVSASYDSGNGQRIGVKVTGQSEVQVDLDPVKMEFGDYKIIKVNGEPINKPVVKVHSAQKVTPKTGPTITNQFITITNLSAPYNVVMKLLPGYTLRWSDGDDGRGTPQLVGKNSKGESIEMEFKCGRHEGEVIFTSILYPDGNIITGNFVASEDINANKFCPVG